MSIQSEVDRIKANVAESYAAVSDMGGALPDTQNSENLAEAVRGIPTGTAAAPGWSGRNLLDNWYFPDPINQRGVASGTLWGRYKYGIDRWLSFNENLTKWVEGEGIWLMVGESSNAIIDQRIEQSAIPIGSTVTLSALVNGQLVSTTTTVTANTDHYERIMVGDYTVALGFAYNYNSLGVCNARVWKQFTNGTGVLVKAAKLEFGSRQTLAHQDAGGNWVLNDPPPNKTLELVKCQRYFIKFGATDAAGMSWGATSNQGAISLITPAVMRTTPVVESYSAEYCVQNSAIVTVTSLYDLNSSGNTVRLRVVRNGNWAANAGINILLGHLTLSADL